MTKELADRLRQAIRDSGHTALYLSKQTGVSQPTITEFLRGADMRLNTASKLADFLGLELVEKPKSK